MKPWAVHLIGLCQRVHTVSLFVVGFCRSLIPGKRMKPGMTAKQRQYALAPCVDEAFPRRSVAKKKRQT